jgi:hypothetical protein
VPIAAPLTENTASSIEELIKDGSRNGAFTMMTRFCPFLAIVGNFPVNLGDF